MESDVLGPDASLHEGFSPLAGIRLVESIRAPENKSAPLGFSPLAGIRLVESQRGNAHIPDAFVVSVPLRGLG